MVLWMSWYVGSTDTSELSIYFIALCDRGRLDMKHQFHISVRMIFPAI